MRQQVGDPRRPDVVRVVLDRRLAELLRHHPRRVLDHDRHRRREAVLQLGEAGAHPDHDDADLGGDDHVDEVGEQAEVEHRRDVLLGARRQEHDLVPEPHQDDQAAVGDERPLRHHAGRAGGQPIDLLARQEQHHHQPEHDQLVEAGVPRRAPVALGERDVVRVRRDPDRVVLPPVQDATDRRIEVERQRTAGGGQAEDLQQDRPHHQLLVEDRLVPPAGDVVELEPLREGATDDQPEQRVEEDLPHVEVDRLLRCAEAVLHPVELQHLHPLEERHLAELVELDGG